MLRSGPYLRDVAIKILHQHQLQQVVEICFLLQSKNYRSTQQEIPALWNGSKVEWKNLVTKLVVLW